ncbi:hypothetical protein E3P99_02160 [Wallemia hederae]|uniref:RAM signaling network component n=1 Tax=Wallemia hederae TaxID=1540922 RepID=A0A4T0FLL0_9BASI|nr:hypothetical protein E3P99_02160 [Wallemia hederae]
MMALDRNDKAGERTERTERTDKRKSSKTSINLSKEEIIELIDRVVHQDSKLVDTWDLSKAGIDTLPVEVIDLIKLDTCRLALSYNRLSRLPDDILSLNKLRYLNLRANMFTSFPLIVRGLEYALEILELGRNKIKKLPKDPGTLTNLKVFSISKNKLTRIPAYIHKFTNLRIIKLDSNPIEWPPSSVIESLNLTAQKAVTNKLDTDKDKLDVEMEAWVRALREWLKEHADKASSKSAYTTDEDSDYHRRRQSGNSFFSDNVLSPPLPKDRGLADSSFKFPAKGTPPTPALASPSTTHTSPDSLSHGSTTFNTPHQYFSPTLDIYNSDYANANASHGRNASSSAILPKRTANTQTQGLKVKKSLPDMRYGTNRIVTDPTPLNAALRNDSLSFAVERKESVDLPPIPTLPTVPTIPDIPKSEAGNHNGFTSLGFPAPSSVSETETSSQSQPSQTHSDTHDTSPLNRNIDHLKNMALKSSDFSTTFKHRHTPTPPSPLSISNTDVVVDAANSLLFALSQAHSAISHFLTLTPDKFAMFLNPLLSNAAHGLDPLFQVLGMKVHNVDMVTEAVKAASAAFSPLIAELRARVAGKFVSDVQFVHPVVLRSVILTLYGSMSEIANVWRVISKHLPTKDENQLQSQQMQQMHKNKPRGSIDKSTKRMYRQGVSLTQADFDYVHSHNPATTTTTASNENADNLPYLDRADDPRTPTSRSPEPQQHALVDKMDTLRVAPRTPPSATVDNVDDAEELVHLIGSCVEVGNEFWPVLDEDVDKSYVQDLSPGFGQTAGTDGASSTDPVLVELREKNHEAKMLTDRLAQSLHAVQNAASNANGVAGLRAADAQTVRTLFENASAFNKMVIWMASLVKGLGEMKRLPLKTRRRMQQIMDLVSELTVQLHVSQYRPLAPSPNSAALNMYSTTSHSNAPSRSQSPKSNKSNKKQQKGLGMSPFPTPVLSRSQSSQPASINTTTKRPPQPRSATNFGAGLTRVFSPTSYSNSNGNGNGNEGHSKKRSLSGYSASSDSTNYD